MEQGLWESSSRLVNEFPVSHKTRRCVILITRARYRIVSLRRNRPIRTHPISSLYPQLRLGPPYSVPYSCFLPTCYTNMSYILPCYTHCPSNCILITLTKLGGGQGCPNPGELNFLQLRQIFVGSLCKACFMKPHLRLEFLKWLLHFFGKFMYPPLKESIMNVIIMQFPSASYEHLHFLCPFRCIPV
jgi:hypothetical protein